MDSSRLKEDRRLHKYRFTYCCTQEDVKTLKMIAADRHMPVNKLINEAVYFYVYTHYTAEQIEAMVFGFPQTIPKLKIYK